MAGQVWVTDNLGGFMFAPNLSKKLRMAVQPMLKFRQFCDVKDGTQGGLGRGDQFHWNVYSNVATAGLIAGLTEPDNAGANLMPVTNFTIAQGTLTVTEFGNSVPYTGKLDALSEHPVTEIINKVLKYDASKTFDGAAHLEFQKTPLRYIGRTNGATTMVAGTDYTLLDNVSGATPVGAANVNGSPLNKAHVANISTLMRERNIPVYTGDDFYCLARPATLSILKGELEAIHQYTPQGFGFIMNGEIGRYRNVRFAEQTNIANTGNFTTNGMSGDAFFFGEDTVAEAVVIPEEIRGMIPQDYGRTKGIAWYALGGFGLSHTLAMGAAQCRIIKWDSALAA